LRGGFDVGGNVFFVHGVMGRWVRCFRTGRYAALVLLLDEMASFPLLRGKGLIIPFADGCAALRSRA
jgi:hypothetical protein